MKGERAFLRSRQWTEFYNESGADIPAFGCIRLTGVSIPSAGRVVRTAAKPNDFGAQYLHAFNGPVICKVGTYGMCVLGQEMVALYDNANAPAFGEKWGPRNDDWMLKKNTGGFQVIGITNSTKQLVLVIPSPMLMFVGKTDAAHAKGASGTISIYEGTLGSETDTTVNMNGVWNRYGDLGASKWATCRWTGAGSNWDLIDGEC